MRKNFFLTDGPRPFTSNPYAALMVATVLLAAVDLGWGLAGHWSIAPRGTKAAILVALGLLFPLVFNRYRRDEKIKVALICTSLLIVFSLTASFFGYLLVSTNEPLVDTTLARWDLALGFDWPRIYLWTKHRPRLDYALALVYSSVFLQISAAIFYLSLTRRREQLAEFNVVLIVSFLITGLVSVYFPAAGPAKFYQDSTHADISLLSHFETIRAGTLRVFDLRAAQGLISIPSFHTIMAVLLTYAMRRTRLFPVFFVLNVAVIASTPTRGGHYLVDLIAGVLTVTAVIVVLRNRASLLARTTLAAPSAIIKNRNDYS
jgi:PAP2 superfamily